MDNPFFKKDERVQCIEEQNTDGDSFHIDSLARAKACCSSVSNFLFWRECPQEIIGSHLPVVVWEKVLQIAKSRLDFAQDMIRISLDQSIDTAAFELFSPWFRAKFLPELIEVMAGQRFDPPIARLCDSRTPVASIESPIGSLHYLNKDEILDCIDFVANQLATHENIVDLAGCRVEVEMSDRMDCLERAISREYRRFPFLTLPKGSVENESVLAL